MKKLIFKTLLVSVILVGAFGKAQAVIVSTPNTNGLTSPTSIHGGQTIVPVGVSLNDPSNSNLTSLTFTCDKTISNYFRSNVINYPNPSTIYMSVVRMTGIGTAYNAGTGVTVTTTTQATNSFNVSGTTITVSNFVSTQTINATGFSYFLVLTFNVGGPDLTPVPVSFNFTLSQVNGAATTPNTGPTYTWDNPAIITASGNNVPNSNGIEVNDIYYTQQGICVFGFSITVANSNAAITQISLSAALSGTAAPFFATSDIYLVENTGTNFHAGTNTPISTTNAVGATSDIIIFNIDTPLDFTPSSPTGSVTRNFFVYANFNSNFKNYPNAVTFSLVKNSVAYTEIAGGGGSPINAQLVNAPQTAIVGTPIAFATPTISFAGQNVIGKGLGGNGITRTTLTFGQTSIAMYGFSVTNTGSQTELNQVNLLTTTPIGVNFQNFKVYRSATDVFRKDTTDVPANLVASITASTSSTAFAIKNLTETLPFNTTTYYFIVGDWTKADVATPTNMQFTLDAVNKIKVNSGATLGYTNTDGQQFSLGAAVYDWIGSNGANSSLWSFSSNWLKNGAASANAPGTSNKDIVRIGVVPYNFNTALIKLPGNTAIGSLQIGKLGSTSPTAASPVILDLVKSTFTIRVGLNVDAAAVFNLTNSSTAAIVNVAAGTSTVASTGVIKFGTPTNSTTLNPLITFTNGTGMFTLLSDGTGTGSIGTIPSNTKVTGTYVVQRYFPGGTAASRAYHLMSSPVNNNGVLPPSTLATATYNFASLKTNLFITGAGGNTNGFDEIAGYGANGPTILFYTTATGVYVPLATSPITTNVNVGTGFYFFFRGDNVHNISQKLIRSPSDNTFAIPETDVVGLQTGTLNQQGLSLTLSNAGNGYNLIGNPYPSNITLTAADIPGTTGYVYSFVPGGNSVNPRQLPVTIASGQAFYVKSNSGTSSINFTEALKTSNATTVPFNTMAPEPVITLKMIQDTANYDIAQLRFANTYNKNYKDTEDADDLSAMGQTALFGAMTADGHVVSIASQPLNKQRTSVYLSVDDAASGVYKIKKMDLSAIPDYYDVRLLDHFKNDSLDIRNNDTYQFTLDKKVPATYGNSRFEVVITKKPLPPYALTDFAGQHTANSNIIKWNTVNEFTYITFEVQYSANNKDFTTLRTMQSLGSGSYNFTDGNATAGYYRLKQTDLDGAVRYSNVVIISVDGKGLGIFSVYPNPTSNFLQFTTSQAVKTTFAVNIYTNIGSLVKSATFNTNTGQLDVSSLMTGFYGIELVDNNSKKTIASAKFIKQ